MQSLFVDNLTVIDFAYFHRERGIIGESLILDVELFGELNDEGMLFDFSYVKKRIKSCVDELVDHKLVVATDNPKVSIDRALDQVTIKLQTTKNQYYRHSSPAASLYLLNDEEVTPNSIMDSLVRPIRSILPNNVTEINLRLRPEKTEGPFFHYAHGLKKHSGDCQRIAHGHRSKIEIFENGEKSDHWSKHIAKMWEDIYLATKEDLKSEDENHFTFEYRANQGQFQLTIPKTRCYLIESDTTVELIASYLASYLAKQKTSSIFKVKAYEGVDKGAISIINATDS